MNKTIIFKRKNNYIFKYSLLLLLFIIILYLISFYYFINREYFIIPQFTDKYFIIPTNKEGEVVAYLDKKSLNNIDNEIQDFEFKNTSEVDFTIITYGGGLSLAIDVSQELAINHDIYCNTVCYTNLSKPNISILDKELMKSKNIILLEEGQNYNSFGSAVLKILSENKISFNLLHSFGNNEIIPSSFIAEQNLLPSVKKIVNTIIKL